ncbi:MAG: RNase E specificity factor CsrD [Parashewanella sp.]
MKLTRMLTKKLASFWLVSLSAVASVFLLSAIISFVHLANRIQQQQVDELQHMLINHHQQYNQWQLKTWLPPVLKSFNVVRFELLDKDKVLYHYQSNIHSDYLTHYQQELDPLKNLSMSLTLRSPYVLHQIDRYELGLLLIALCLIILFVRVGMLWLKKQLLGVEELVYRGQLVLENKHEQAFLERGNGQPRILNRALTKLLAELQDAQKERSRFDKFIRSNTFLDASTGIGNRLFLKNRLTALSNEHGMIAHGVIYFLEMEELDVLQQDVGEAAINDFLRSCISALDVLLDSQANSFLARRSFNQFAIVIPQISLSEADVFANKVLKICLRLPLPDGVKLDDFYHIGGAYFSVGDDSSKLLEEADMALRAAQYQGNSNWFMYDKGSVDQEFAKGSVRWRSLLELALERKRLVAFAQPIVDHDNKILHQEVYARIKETNGNFIRANQYVPMAIKCGLMPQIDRRLIENLLTDHLKHAKNRQQGYSINLSIDSVKSDSFAQWLEDILTQHSELVPLLNFEVTERIATRQTSKLSPLFRKLSSMGASLSVDFVGQQVVGSAYLKELNVNAIKLHRSIVSQIHLRPENQLFVRSLIGALYRTDIQVFAEGVECLEEWQTLRILGVSAAQGTFFSDLVEL